MPRPAETQREIAHWLHACRKHVCDNGQLIKIAELGGDGQDAPFEQAFSNLAHAYLKDGAPTLLDHELGFQLMDRNQENTKAVGVFAFKVGSQNLFAPVFFLKGELKGHELLYLRNQDMFVPLKENWLNYILNRKPNILGTGTSRQSGQFGVRQPDLNRMVQSPYKYASHISPTLRPFLPAYAHLATTDWGGALDEFTTHCQERLDLGHFMKQASLPMLESAVKLMQQRPRIAEAFNRWHGMTVLQDAIKEARARMSTTSILDSPYHAVNRNRPIITGSILKTAEDGYQQKIKIITMDSSQVDSLPEGLTEEDQEKLLKDTVLIQDERSDDEVSVPLNIQVEERLTNPSETGVFQVLTKPGDFEKCLIVIDPQGPDGRKNVATVVRLDESTRNWGNFQRNEIWVASLDESKVPGGEDAWQDWFDSLPDVSSLAENSDGRYMAIGPRRNATCPFRVYEEIGTSQGTKSYRVDFSTSHNRPHAVPLSHHTSAANARFDDYDSWYDGQRVHLDAKDGTDLRSNHGDLYIPKGYKLLKLEPTKSDENEKKKDLGPSCCGPYDSSQSDPPPVMPGRIIDATMQIMKKTAALKVAYDGVGYVINNQQSLPLSQAVVYLVKGHGLREKISRHILKVAEERKRFQSHFSCRVKYASPFLTDGGPSAPYVDDYDSGGYNPMGWGGPTQLMQEREYPIHDLSGSNTDPNIYNVNPANTPEPMDANNVARAAQTGQREVFDTAMIGSMLKAVRDDTMIDRYLPDLIKGVDRLGRILFMFYWHQDKFAERYGKQDMPELEDSIRNAFEMMGDVVLFLKQKTVEPYPEEDIRDLDLTATAS